MAGKIANNASADVASAEEMYTIRLPRLKGNNAQQTEFFSVNGRNYLVERGKNVTVPKEVYEVYMNSLDAEDAADEFAVSVGLKEPK